MFGAGGGLGLDQFGVAIDERFVVGGDLEGELEGGQGVVGVAGVEVDHRLGDESGVGGEVESQLLGVAQPSGAGDAPGLVQTPEEEGAKLRAREQLLGVDRAPEALRHAVAVEHLDEGFEASGDAALRVHQAQGAGQGDEAIELMLELARESEHPRAFEVLGQLIKQNAEIGEKILKLHKSKKEVDKEDDMPALASIGPTNNNVFIGSTAELQKMLRDEKVIDTEPDLFDK